MSAYIEIRAPGATPIRRDIGKDALVIGRKPRDAGSGVAIPGATDLADEHLIVSLVRDRFHVALAMGARVEPCLDGKPFRQAEVPFGTEVSLGQLVIRLTGEAKRAAVSPVILFAGASLVGLLVWSSLQHPADAPLKNTLPQGPSLFEADKPCPYAGPQALAQAAQSEQAAMAHGERYNFDPRDGVAAVDAYRASAACYTSGGDAASAARARANGQHWQTRLESTYHGHQLRLRMALDRGRDDHALHEVRELKRLLRGKNNEFTSWLTMAERRLRGL
jgi:hypothetical protein